MSSTPTFSHKPRKFLSLPHYQGTLRQSPKLRLHKFRVDSRHNPFHSVRNCGSNDWLKFHSCTQSRSNNSRVVWEAIARQLTTIQQLFQPLMLGQLNYTIFRLNLTSFPFTFNFFPLIFNFFLLTLILSSSNFNFFHRNSPWFRLGWSLFHDNSSYFFQGFANKKNFSQKLNVYEKMINSN